MPPVDVVDYIADDADVDSSVISERDNGVDHDDVNLVDILAHRLLFAYIITFHEKEGQARDRAQGQPRKRVSSPLGVAPSVD